MILTVRVLGALITSVPDSRPGAPTRMGAHWSPQRPTGTWIQSPDTDAGVRTLTYTPLVLRVPTTGLRTGQSEWPVTTTP